MENKKDRAQRVLRSGKLNNSCRTSPPVARVWRLLLAELDVACADVGPPCRVHVVNGDWHPRARPSGNPGAATLGLQPAGELTGASRGIGVGCSREIRRYLSTAVAPGRIRAVGTEHPWILTCAGRQPRNVQRRPARRVDRMHVRPARKQQRAGLVRVNRPLCRVQRCLAVVIAAGAHRARGAAPIERLPVGKLPDAQIASAGCSQPLRAWTSAPLSRSQAIIGISPVSAATCRSVSPFNRTLKSAPKASSVSANSMDPPVRSDATRCMGVLPRHLVPPLVDRLPCGMTGVVMRSG